MISGTKRGFAAFTMIRRVFSTFIDYHSPITQSDFFQPSTFGIHRIKEEHWPIDNFSFLLNFSPCFPVNSTNVRIINEPIDFYKSILENASKAKYRISLASLYLGIGKMESDLVDAIKNNMSENDKLKVNILLDFTRGTRGKINSKLMLMPLIKQSTNCTVSLYHTPLLRGITKKIIPARWNELVGLQHMKIYLFDDSVIISGANLSNDYFTNRQDRYVEINDQKLSNFFAEILEKVHAFSLKVQMNGECTLHDNWKFIPYESNYKDFVNEARKSIQSVFKKAYDEQINNDLMKNDADTWLFPTLEMGQLNIHHDSLVTKKILSEAKVGSSLKMATGYFNLTQTYMDSLVNECKADCSIIMAHPNANGFKGSKFPSSGIPDAYSLLAKKFYKQIKEQKQQKRISLLEYEREKWTYHAKGLWYHSNINNHQSEWPCMTIIGSSNYGERSVNRDLEAQVCIITKSKELQQSLKNEYDHILNYASKAENQLITRVIPNWVKTVVLLFKKYF
ncbi:hypothetical protein PVAND_003593 [Polypedilum vanderplanki]|uniref:CDP-diacylglycerol--glycerol-3-phosphate 3-phosphatidyltransferase n=1 Tax=Polypedilum vanderplanki TaxID=319348 RepID=A0A9J6BUI2_POLVA|nr:hypothetical protein PVAND_003593 [Polypedilum vanderplanki]